MKDWVFLFGFLACVWFFVCCSLLFYFFTNLAPTPSAARADAPGSVQPQTQMVWGVRCPSSGTCCRSCREETVWLQASPSHWHLELAFFFMMEPFGVISTCFECAMWCIVFEFLLLCTLNKVDIQRKLICKSYCCDNNCDDWLTIHQWSPIWWCWWWFPLSCSVDWGLVQLYWADWCCCCCWQWWRRRRRIGVYWYQQVQQQVDLRTSLLRLRVKHNKEGF